MRKIITILIFLLISFLTQSQQKKQDLKTYSFQEVEAKFLKNPKPILVFVYTDWCKICFGMKKTTFKNKNVITTLNKNFYVVLLNGEEKKEITFFGRKFTHKPSGLNVGNHELAIEIGLVNGKVNYPTTVILNKDLEINSQFVGFINSKKMQLILENKNL